MDCVRPEPEKMHDVTQPITGEVLKSAEDIKDTPHCWVIEREAD